MIQKVSIKGEATFDQTGIELDDLKMINVIYGSNGTGKSTISKILANVDEYPQCEIQWEDDASMDVLSYNKDFREKNYSEQIPGGLRWEKRLRMLWIKLLKGKPNLTK